jgi:hypothetical protein
LIEDAKRFGLHFQLRPFIFRSSTEELSLSGFIARKAGSLLIENVVRGPLELIHWPSTPMISGRCHELWRHSCFEVFFGIKGEPAYWEVNLCLRGCWNAYRFDGYRSGMQEEGAFAQPLCHVVEDNDVLSLTCSIDLNAIVDDSAELEVGLSSVIEAKDGTIDYWAIEHYGPVPDFHNRQSFSVVLPGSKNFNIHGA